MTITVYNITMYIVILCHEVIVLVFLGFIVFCFLTYLIIRVIVFPIARIVGRHIQRKEEKQNRLYAQEMVAKNRKTQQQLVDQYAHSPLTREILEYISVGGSNHRPEIIDIYCDRVTGITKGIDKTYDFHQHRVQNIPEWHGYIEYCEIENQVRPRVAFANALNSICGYQYSCHNHGVYTHLYEGDESIICWDDGKIAVRLQIK